MGFVYELDWGEGIGSYHETGQCEEQDEGEGKGRGGSVFGG